MTTASKPIVGDPTASETGHSVTVPVFTDESVPIPGSTRSITPVEETVHYGWFAVPGTEAHWHQGIIRLSGPDSDRRDGRGPRASRSFTMADPACPMWAKNASGLHMPTTVVIDHARWSLVQRIATQLAGELTTTPDVNLRHMVEASGLALLKALNLSP